MRTDAKHVTKPSRSSVLSPVAGAERDVLVQAAEKAMDSYRLSHYQNVYRLLKLWGCREELCLAGLLHGTIDKVSQLRSVRPTDLPHEDDTADMAEVSRLLAAYGALYRGRDLLAASFTGAWTDWQIQRFELEGIEAENASIRDHLTLEVANQFDKYRDTPFIADYLASINKVATIIPIKAAEYLYNTIVRSREKPDGAMVGVQEIHPSAAKVPDYYALVDVERSGTVAAAVHGLLRFGGYYSFESEYMPLPRHPHEQQGDLDAQIGASIHSHDHCQAGTAARWMEQSNAISLSPSSNLPVIAERITIFRRGGKSALQYYMPFLLDRQPATSAENNQDVPQITLKSSAYDAPFANMVTFLAALAKFNYEKLHDLNALQPAAETIRQAYDYADRLGRAITLLSGNLSYSKLAEAHAVLLGPPRRCYRSLLVKVGSQPGLDGVGNACPPPRTVPGYMNDFIALFNETDAADTRSLSRMYLQFLLIHPFPDGNGRVARCLAVSKLISMTKTPSVGALALLAMTLDKRRLDDHVNTLNSDSYRRSIDRWNRYMHIAADVNAQWASRWYEEWSGLYPGPLMNSLALGSLRPFISWREFQQLSHEYDALDAVYMKVSGRDDFMICRHLVNVAVGVRRAFELGGIA